MGTNGQEEVASRAFTQQGEDLSFGLACYV